MFRMQSKETKTGAAKLIVAYRKTLISLAFWTLGDGGQHDPSNRELSTILKNILISAGDAEVAPHLLNRYDHRIVPPRFDGRVHAGPGKSGGALRIGWDSEKKEDQNETQDV